jgi:hypothetical protein
MSGLFGEEQANPSCNCKGWNGSISRWIIDKLRAPSRRTSSA